VTAISSCGVLQLSTSIVGTSVTFLISYLVGISRQAAVFTLLGNTVLALLLGSFVKDTIPRDLKTTIKVSFYSVHITVDDSYVEEKEKFLKSST
jgi:hypothetical protein